VRRGRRRGRRGTSRAWKRLDRAPPPGGGVHKPPVPWAGALERTRWAEAPSMEGPGQEPVDRALKCTAGRGAWARACRQNPLAKPGETLKRTATRWHLSSLHQGSGQFTAPAALLRGKVDRLSRSPARQGRQTQPLACTARTIRCAFGHPSTNPRQGNRRQGNLCQGNPRHPRSHLLRENSLHTSESDPETPTRIPDPECRRHPWCLSVSRCRASRRGCGLPWSGSRRCCECTRRDRRRWSAAAPAATRRTRSRSARRLCRTPPWPRPPQPRYVRLSFPLERFCFCRLSVCLSFRVRLSVRLPIPLPVHFLRRSTTADWRAT
jgi:hypothetical protein